MRKKDRNFLFSCLSFVIILSSLIIMSRYNKTYVFYVPDINMYMSMSKTQKGCYITFEEGKYKRISKKKKDYILIPNTGIVYILYDPTNKNNLYISPTSFTSEKPVMDSQELRYKFFIYLDNNRKSFFSKYYDEVNKKYKDPYKLIHINAREKIIYIDGQIFDKGPKYGKPW